MSSSKPNILIIWGDDIGQSNLSCYSSGLMGWGARAADGMVGRRSLVQCWKVHEHAERALRLSAPLTLVCRPSAAPCRYRTPNIDSIAAEGIRFTGERARSGQGRAGRRP